MERVRLGDICEVSWGDTSKTKASYVDEGYPAFSASGCDGLPSLTVEQRQMLVRRAIELDDRPLSSAEEHLVEERRAKYRRDPASGLSLGEIERRLRTKFER